MTPAFLLFMTVFGVWPDSVSPCHPVDTGKDDCYCGLAKRRLTSKVAGGKRTGVNEYPWQVLVIGWKGPCGGSLISDQWVLTAAHCVDNGTKASDMTLSLGEHDTTNQLEADTVVMNVTEIIIHGKYNPKNYFYDFALLKLKSKINFGSHPHIRPICLPADGSNNDYSGYTATATGWGHTSFGGSNSPHLLEVDLTVSSPTECRLGWRDYFPYFDPILCAKGAIRTGTCQGDSGGPLVTKEWYHSGTVPGENYELIGVTSFGRKKTCVNVLEGFARVTDQLKWIREKTKDSWRTCPRI